MKQTLTKNPAKTKKYKKYMGQDPERVLISKKVHKQPDSKGRVTKSPGKERSNLNKKPTHDQAQKQSLDTGTGT